MALGSVPAAIGGVYVLERLKDAFGNDFDDRLIVILAVTLLFTGLMTLARALFLRRLADKERDSVEFTRRNKIRAVTLGATVGFVLGATSAGSGALIAVGLIVLFRLVPSRVVGTDVFHAAILLWAASLAHVVAGNVDFGLAGNILVGSVPGVWLGSNLTLQVSGERPADHARPGTDRRRTGAAEQGRRRHTGSGHRRLPGRGRRDGDRGPGPGPPKRGPPGGPGRPALRLTSPAACSRRSWSRTAAK